MQRGIAQAWMSHRGLAEAAIRYGADPEAFQLMAAYEGCANLVYACVTDGHQRILRVTYRDDRDEAMLRAELDWVLALDGAGVRVAKPVASCGGRLIETLDAPSGPLWMVVFERGRGIRVPDNGYRYREEAPLSEYYCNWGRTLGAMHRCARDFEPAKGVGLRPDWLHLHEPRRLLRERVPGSPGKGEWAAVHRWANALLDEVRALPQDADAYGMIHGDLNDGNFVVDYDNGDITVFDFDDCCRFWFIYELAVAWEGGVGRTMFEPSAAKRKAFMERYMDTLLEGYAAENRLSDAWLARLPLLVRLAQLETFLHYAQYIVEDDPEDRGLLRYLRRCFELDLPWMGFYSDVYDHERPFMA